MKTIKDIVKVQFKSQAKKVTSETFTNTEYTYFSNIDLAVGDVIIVPTQSGGRRARVCKIGLKESDIPADVMPYVRTIEELITKLPSSHVVPDFRTITRLVTESPPSVKKESRLFEYRHDDKTGDIVITRAKLEAIDLNIPAEIDGLPVTIVGERDHPKNCVNL